MNNSQDPFMILNELPIKSQKKYLFYSLRCFERNTEINIQKLPYSIKLLLENALRNYDGIRITKRHILEIAHWAPQTRVDVEVPFLPTRIILQDYTGIPLLVDLAAMRNALSEKGVDPNVVIPKIETKLIVDHSLKIIHSGSANALKINMAVEQGANQERYQFIKWAMHAFDNLEVIPAGNGIIHQINLEHMAQGLVIKNGVCFPESVLGTDSHTTMINCLGVLGWGVGGIEAEASMLDFPYYMTLPEVIAVELSGKLRSGVLATDLVLAITNQLRKIKLTGKFVEFIGEGVKTLSIPDRAIISNMAPEYGATIGFFHLDDSALEYYASTGKTQEQIDLIRDYYTEQGLFDNDATLDCCYSDIVKINLDTIIPCIAGPTRPQDKIELINLKSKFEQIFPLPIKGDGGHIQHGDILIASITSCANTSNPYMILAAGILAKKAVLNGLQINPKIKTSLIPGSRAVGRYLEKSKLQDYLNKLGFHIAGYGCGVCNGNGGGLKAEIEEELSTSGNIACSVLSGNRNFAARIHPVIRANFLMSPPLVIAFAIFGNIRINLEKEPIGFNPIGQPIYLKDIWPAHEEIMQLMAYAVDPELYKDIYSNLSISPFWQIDRSEKCVPLYGWEQGSTYIAEPPFFKLDKNNKVSQDVFNARVLLILGDAITTDHISPVGAISSDSSAGDYLQKQGVLPAYFNSYGSRRGHHEVMQRGAFSNLQLENHMLKQVGGLSIHHPSQKIERVYDVAVRYQQENVPLIIIAGEDYGCGSSRDWAAKGTALLGVKIIIAKSFERIHRSNLLCMGVLPCVFSDEHTRDLEIKGTETFDIIGFTGEVLPRQKLILLIREDGTVKSVPIEVSIYTQIEATYFNQGGVLPYLLDCIVKKHVQKEGE